MSTEKFKSLLDEKYQWPCHYTFKFVVNTDNEGELANIFESDQVQKRSSRTGKYISYTVTKLVDSSDHVIEIYSRASSIDGVMSL